MKVFAAMKQAWKLYTGHFGSMMEFMLLEVVLRLIVLTPALFLTMKGLELGALACIPLFILIVLPARQNAAEIMQEAVRGGDIFSARLVVTKEYWKRLGRGVRQGLLLLLWLAPFIAGVAWIMQFVVGNVVQGRNDVFTLIRNINQLGSGDLQRGVVNMMLIYVGLFLPFLVGCAFHSGRRHERALGKQKVICGHRGGLMLTWLLSNVTVVPFAAVTGWVGLDYVKKLVAAVNSLATGLKLPPLDQNVYIILGAFVVLMLPLVPFKSLMTACYVHGLWEGKE